MVNVPNNNVPVTVGAGIPSRDWYKFFTEMVRSVDGKFPTSPSAAEAAAMRASLGIETGSWTPTLTDGTNIAGSTASVCWYARTNDVVLIGGRFRSTRTSGAFDDTELGISLPIVSDIQNDTDGWGTVTGLGGGAAESGWLTGFASGDRLIARWFSNSTGNVFSAFSGGYVIR